MAHLSLLPAAPSSLQAAGCTAKHGAHGSVEPHGNASAKLHGGAKHESRGDAGRAQSERQGRAHGFLGRYILLFHCTASWTSTRWWIALLTRGYLVVQLTSQDHELSLLQSRRSWFWDSDGYPKGSYWYVHQGYGWRQLGQSDPNLGLGIQELKFNRHQRTRTWWARTRFQLKKLYYGKDLQNRRYS